MYVLLICIYMRVCNQICHQSRSVVEKLLHMFLKEVHTLAKKVYVNYLTLNQMIPIFMSKSWSWKYFSFSLPLPTMLLYESV